MKLKKIAALALAGVMAVSMLAGCGTDKKPGTGEGEGEGTVTTTGYSAVLGKAVDLSADQAKYISFADNTADQAALEKVVAGMSTQTLENIAKSWKTPTGLEKSGGADSKEALANLETDLKTSREVATNAMGMSTFAAATSTDINTKGIRTAGVFAFNGGVDTDYALNTIATTVAEKLTATNAPKKGVATAAGTSWDYTYTVSASVVTRAQQSNYTGATDTATFVLVTISRTVTNAEV